MKIKEKIILVSASPRRKQILHDAGFDFEVRATTVDESFDTALPPEMVPQMLARRKVEAYGSTDPESIIVGADTVVIVNGEILNKPENPAEARAMLTRLSHRPHQVVTGVCIRTAREWITFSDTTTVYFKALSAEEIAFYVDRYPPLDKAGAYGVQDFIGMIGITRLEGSFYTVMGLPVHLVYHYLQPYIQWNA